MTTNGHKVNAEAHHWPSAFCLLTREAEKTKLTFPLKPDTRGPLVISNLYRPLTFSCFFFLSLSLSPPKFRLPRIVFLSLSLSHARRIVIQGINTG